MPGGQASLGEGARARPPPPAAGATGCGGPGASAGAWEWPCRSAVVTSRHWPPPPRSATGRPASRWLGAALGDQAAGRPRPLRRRRSAAARQPPAASWGGRSRRSALLFWCLFPTDDGESSTVAATTRTSGRGGRAQAHRGCCGRRVPAGASPPLTVCCLVASRPGRGRRRGQRLGRSRHPAPPARSACVPSWPPTGCATGSRHGEQGGGAFLADSH